MIRSTVTSGHRPPTAKHRWNTCEKIERYIVATSIIVQALTVVKHTAHVKALFRGLTNADELLIPEFCLLECTNVHWKHVRFQDLSLFDAELLVEDLVDLPLTVQYVTTLLKSGLRIGVKHQLPLYDSVYIAMAKHFNIPLITDDIKQGQVAVLEGVVLKAITDFN